jgi:hypothetical protein
MARILATLIVLAFSGTLLAQDRPPVDPLAKASPTPEHKPNAGDSPGMHRPGQGGPGFFAGPEAEKARQAFQQMNPEERQRWMQRFKEFAELPLEKKKEIFDRIEYGRRKMREDVEAAVKESGLTLNDEQKKKFSERYFEERKKLEEDLRKQMEEMRRPKVQALIERLKQEFAAQSSGTPQ